jgi:ParB family transcriptional regulator, chromosome partitioning protein
MNRRDHIKDLYTSTAETEKLAMANFSKPTPSSGDRLSAGPVRTMGLTLDRMEQERRDLQEALAAGVKVVELDPELIEPSLIRDRLPNPSDARFVAFKRLIEENGQEVPILARPHPEKEGRFQIAYGNRRRMACLELGRKVKAIVRKMSDGDLVVAQGTENSGRENLSYIERAFYAARLEDRGFDRNLIMTALHTDKGELSKLISVARAVPERIAESIGPAPRAGRRRWLALAEVAGTGRGLRAIEQACQDPDLPSLETDVRFIRVLTAATSQPRTSANVTTWRSMTGRASAVIRRGPKTTNLSIVAADEPEFAEFVASRLDDLYANFSAQAKANA